MKANKNRFIASPLAIWDSENKMYVAPCGVTKRFVNREGAVAWAAAQSVAYRIDYDLGAGTSLLAVVRQFKGGNYRVELYRNEVVL